MLNINPLYYHNATNIKSAHNKYICCITYIVAARGVTSALVISCFERERAQRFTKQAFICDQWLKPIIRDDKSHNGASQNKWSRRCDVTYIIFVAGLGLANQEVTFWQIQPMKSDETSMAMMRWLSRTFLSKHKFKISKTSSH
jgi:hypothetical protein